VTDLKSIVKEGSFHKNTKKQKGISHNYMVMRYIGFACGSISDENPRFKARID
jgi:hypothetical protein